MRPIGATYKTHPDGHPDFLRLSLTHEAMADLYFGKLDALLDYLRHHATEDRPLPKMLREFLADLIDGDSSNQYRLQLVKHPELRITPQSETAAHDEMMNMDKAVVAFLNSNGVEYSDLGISAAMEATGWGRTKTREFLTKERIAAMKEAVTNPELGLDPVGAGLGVKASITPPMQKFRDLMASASASKESEQP